MPDIIRDDPAINKKILEYCLQLADQSARYWQEPISGTRLNRKTALEEYRLRYKARRSVAELYNDAKTKPFPRSSNIGIGVENIFGEYLVPVNLQNTVDLEPCVEAKDIASGQVDDPLTYAHDDFLRNEMTIRNLYEQVYREVYTVGNCINKWVWGSLWRQRETRMTVLVDPRIGQPIFRTNPQTGEQEPIPVDPKMPEEMLPVDPFTGIKMRMKDISSVEMYKAKNGPQMHVRPIESIDIPPNAMSQDPDDWDYIGDNYTVNAWWLLSREGDPYNGRIPKENLDKMWKALGVTPESVWIKPDGRLSDPIHIKEYHLKFPVTRSGRPVEIIVLFDCERKILLTWRLTAFLRRPFFNHQVWSNTQSPFGIGICESVYGLRGAIDATLNQDVDSGNLYNHPPLLLSSLAMLEDEDYETVGPGTIWTMQNVEGAKFLSPPVPKRDPIALLNWLISMTQRVWGVTDLNLNAPTSSLSPNVNTATGTVAILNQGTVKFGHLTKRFEATRTKEMQFFHDMKSEMMTDQEIVSDRGNPQQVGKEFYRQGIRMRAVGDGVFSNPQVRQQTLMGVGKFHIDSQNPFVVGDLEVWKELTEQINNAHGLKLSLKDPPMLQQIQAMTQLLQTPIGQAKVQEAITLLRAEQQAMASKNGNGVPVQ